MNSKKKPSLVKKELKPEQPESLKIETAEGIAYITSDKNPLQPERLIRTKATLFEGGGGKEFKDDLPEGFAEKLNQLLEQRDEILKRDHTKEELEANQKAIHELSRQVIIEAQPKRKPFFSTYSSNSMLTFWKALLTTETKTDEGLTSIAIRYKDTWQFDWERGKPNNEAILFFLRCISEYRQTKRPNIKINMSEWKQLRKTERATPYKELASEIDKLYYASAYLNSKKVRLITGIDIPKEGKTTYIEIGIHQEFAYECSKNLAFMYLSEAIYAINPKRNPHSIQMLLNIFSHIALNKTYCIPIKWLLSELALPTEEEVKANMGRHYKQKIIDPFQRDLNALCQTFNWKFVSGSDESWTEFKNGSIEISFINPHPHNAKIEQKNNGTGAQKTTAQVRKNNGTGAQKQRHRCAKP